MITYQPLALPHPDWPMLQSAAEAENHGFVARTFKRWMSGQNRFDNEGECFLGAFSAHKLVGFGGLGLDPYLSDPTLCRLRHLYVLPSYRGQGVGAELVRLLIKKGQQSGFVTMRLRAANQQAGRLYEKMGFATTDEAEATHRLTL